MNVTEYERFLRAQPQLKSDPSKAENYFNSLNKIKEYYQHYENEIIDYHKANPKRWFASYPVDWLTFFSPIETMAWNQIRSLGNMPLYPQYPVLNYFIDFANPGYKIAVELDGKAFHDKERDKARDEQLKAHGWTIYRITGKEMINTNYMDYSEIHELFYSYFEKHEAATKMRYWLAKTGDGILTAIKQIHFSEADDNTEDELQNKKVIYSRQTLDAHRS